VRVVWLGEFGGPEVLVPGQAPEPVPGPGQALIEVAYANITFVETQFRATGSGPFHGSLPMIPGNGVGGLVAAVGPDVDPGLVGRRVVSGTGGAGGYAERVAVTAAGLVPVPEGLALDEAVALLADGRTATMLIDAAAPRPGERVLVEAAAGGVGTLLVQLARAAGARVVAAAGGGRKVELVRDLGVDLAVDYRQPDWADQVRDAVGGVDVVFDGVGGPIGRTAFELLDPGGRMVNFGLASGEWADIPAEAAEGRGVRLVRPSATPEQLRTFTARRRYRSGRPTAAGDRSAFPHTGPPTRTPPSVPRHMQDLPRRTLTARPATGPCRVRVGRVPADQRYMPVGAPCRARLVALAEEALAAELAVQPVVQLVGQPGHHLHGEHQVGGLEVSAEDRDGRPDRVVGAVEPADRHPVGQLGELHVEALGRLDLGEHRGEDVDQRRVVADPDEDHRRACPDVDVPVRVDLQLVGLGLEHVGDDGRTRPPARTSLFSAWPCSAAASASSRSVSTSRSGPNSLRAVPSGSTGSGSPSASCTR
jgi:NADPH2:quinone reductase